MDREEQDQFERIELVAKIERSETIIQQYFDGILHYTAEIKTFTRRLGRLDERWGG